MPESNNTAKSKGTFDLPEPPEIREGVSVEENYTEWEKWASCNDDLYYIINKFKHKEQAKTMLLTMIYCKALYNVRNSK